MGIISVFVMFLFTEANLNVRAADSPTSIKVEYKIYDYDSYEAHLTEEAYWDGWDTDFAKQLEKPIAR